MHGYPPQQHRQRAILAAGLLGDGAGQCLCRTTAFARQAGGQGVAANGGCQFGQRSAHGFAARMRAQPRVDLRITADGENGQSARGQPRVRAVGGDQVLDARNVAFEHRVVAQQWRRHRSPRQGFGQRPDTLAASGDGRHHGDAERLAQGSRVDRHAARLGFVGHVQRHHHRYAQFGQQRGEIERAAQVLGVADLDQRAHVLIEQCAHGGPLVVAARRQGEYPRGVEQ